MNTFAERLKFELDRTGPGAMSRLARAVGVTPQAVRGWVADGREPKAEMMEKIAAFLNVDATYLHYGDNPPPTGPREPVLEFLVGDEFRLIQNFRRATEDGKQQLLLSSDVIEKIPEAVLRARANGTY